METISKARELCLTYSKTNTTESVNPIRHNEEDTHLNQVEVTLQNLSEQLLALNTRRQDPLQCFNCGKLDHVARNYRVQRTPPRTVPCFKCRTGDIWYVTAGTSNKETAKGAPQAGKLGVYPDSSECSHNTTLSCIHYRHN